MALGILAQILPFWRVKGRILPGIPGGYVLQADKLGNLWTVGFRGMQV